jgi:hypothetical protein
MVRISLIRSDDSNGMSIGMNAIATAGTPATAGKIPQQEVNHSRRSTTAGGQPQK